ncbi:hypothetical protein HPB47_028307 [Ixodes persulcatus]|uniref:Uncharacterized protein n=1 Tax=Ixodes persulcatus TaxID=34615 RepID=A0AC60PV22_IXOPE|nr:hypothetical protein HPB47_028307 [Ixodes persulcatus]
MSTANLYSTTRAGGARMHQLVWVAPGAVAARPQPPRGGRAIHDTVRLTRDSDRFVRLCGVTKGALSPTHEATAPRRGLDLRPSHWSHVPGRGLASFPVTALKPVPCYVPEFRFWLSRERYLMCLWWRELR